MIKNNMTRVVLSVFLSVSSATASQTTQTLSSSGKGIDGLKVKVVELARQILTQMNLRLRETQQKLEKPLKTEEEATLKEKQDRLMVLADKVEKIISDKKYDFANHPVPCTNQDKDMMISLKTIEQKLTGKSELAQSSKELANRSITFAKTICQ